MKSVLFQYVKSGSSPADTSYNSIPTTFYLQDNMLFLSLIRNLSSLNELVV